MGTILCLKYKQRACLEADRGGEGKVKKVLQSIEPALSKDPGRSFWLPHRPHPRRDSAGEI
jgi:hypothetical protein